MFWDKAAGLYDLFEYIYNGRVNRQIVKVVSGLVEEDDRVLECACGTGMISKGMAKVCRELVATDFSDGMLRVAMRKLKPYKNVKVRRADITALKAKDGSFDKVVAGNVIHLLDEPYKALEELLRVCKTGGKVIVPTYVNNQNGGKPGAFVKAIEKFGAGFKCQFDFDSYIEFFEGAGQYTIEYILIEGKMPCAIAVISK